MVNEWELERIKETQIEGQKEKQEWRMAIENYWKRESRDLKS